MDKKRIHVDCEVGKLRRVLIHSPDGGIGKVVPAKAQDWLYEDIVDLKAMQDEYDVYKKTLLAYLDGKSLAEWFEKESTSHHDLAAGQRPSYVQPDRDDFIDSDAVVEVQGLLGKILENKQVRNKLVSTICGLERMEFIAQQRLLNEDTEWLQDYEEINPKHLAKILISGFLRLQPTEAGKAKGVQEINRQLFPPVPNFIFTRDIGIVVNDHLLLSKLSKTVRTRESMLLKYIAHYELFPNNWERIVELPEDSRFFLYDEEELQQNIVTVEGGDVMIVSPDHLLIGCSERTTPNAVNKVVQEFFDKSILKKVTAVIIPSQRETMHIDTAFTQVERDCWVMYGPFSKMKKKSQENSYLKELLDEESRKDLESGTIRLVQFINEKDENGRYKERSFQYLEDLLDNISTEDYGRPEGSTRFIYCGGLNYPDDLREQWTDACNVVAVEEGVVIGYDRNRTTSAEFAAAGYNVVHANELVANAKKQWTKNSDVDLSEVTREFVGPKALILLPSSELSRARGGSHCMSMPLLRDSLIK